MYFDEPNNAVTIDAPLDMQFVLSINAMTLLALGILPQTLMQICGVAIVNSLQ